MFQFTVIGHYTTDGTVFAHQVEATNAADAIKIAARDAGPFRKDLFILGAIEGWHNVRATNEGGDRHGTGAFAQDLLGR